MDTRTYFRPSKFRLTRYIRVSLKAENDLTPHSHSVGVLIDAH
jgi:hypothetical protein